MVEMGEKYSITEKNIRVHEIIGFRAKVVKSSDRSRIGMQGKIIDETMKTFRIETEQGEKIVPKREIAIEIEIGKGKKVLIEGKELEKRPEDRTKELWRKCL